MGIIVTGRVQNVVIWCRENISAQVYYLPSDNTLRVGGIGWEVFTHGADIELRCKDETLGTFLALKYGISIKINPKNTS